MTGMQKIVYDVLTDQFKSPDEIAHLAGIHTISPRETASRYCIQLTKDGRAEKGGTGMFPRWRLKP